jgi:hypothetical protein
MEPPFMVLVFDDNPYGLMVALSFSYMEERACVHSICPEEEEADSSWTDALPARVSHLESTLLVLIVAYLEVMDHSGFRHEPAI